MLEKVLLVLAAISILAICAIIFSGVVTRAVFNWSMPDAEILVRDLMIASIILPLAYVTAERTHIAVDVFVNLMPKAVRPWSDLLGSVIGFLVLLPIAYGGWKGFHSAWIDGNYYYGEFDLPEWPGKLAFALGYAVFVLRLLSLVIIDFKAVFNRGISDPAP
ncbi:TRAP transporter small permease [Labrenzia sp. PHM005]|uniref:TRAP transporter small permease n=1 Tax=Labrenzia sp. PHM005 TaxID=2590016 RepID=UPI00143E0067|nr:TRAP transporter small permease [Labrenzia sp. PHM005]